MMDDDGITPEQAPKAKRPRRLLAETQAYLVTPATIAKGFELVGAQWSPTETPGEEHGLYTWVSGTGATPPMRSGVLYIGVAAGAKGLKKRLSDEESWRGGDHAHGIALERNDARVLAGPVTYDHADLTWVEELIKAEMLAPRALAIIDSWTTERTLAAVEEVAIRLAIHLGDTGAPVNSTHGGAWANDRAGDWVAFAVAQELSRRAARDE